EERELHGLDGTEAGELLRELHGERVDAELEVLLRVRSVASLPRLVVGDQNALAGRADSVDLSADGRAGERKLEVGLLSEGRGGSVLAEPRREHRSNDETAERLRDGERRKLRRAPALFGSLD